MLNLLAFLGYLAPVIVWALDLLGVSNANKEKFKKLVENASKDNLVAVQARDVFKAQDEELEKDKPNG